MNLLIQSIKSESPNAFNEFDTFIREKYKIALAQLNEGYENLEFQFLLGVFLDFFYDQSIEFEMDLINYDIENIQKSISMTFENYEKVIGHFS